MIIDTESPEGRALVALAKFGKWALDTSREYISDIDALDVEEKAEKMGLLRAWPCDESCSSDACPNDPDMMCLRYTALAQLPEGL